MEEKAPLKDRKSLWLSIIASILVAFLSWLLMYISEFIPKKIQAPFIVAIFIVLFIGAIMIYKNQ